MLLRYFSFFVLRSYHFYHIRPLLSFGRRKKRNKKKREGGNNTTTGHPFFSFFLPQQHKRRTTRTQDATRDERRESPKKNRRRRRKKKPANQHQQKEEKKGAIVVFVFICIERLLSLWRLESRLRWTTTTRYYSRNAFRGERERERICAFFFRRETCDSSSWKF